MPYSRGSSQTQGSNPGVSSIGGGFFYRQSQQGIPRILQWVAYPFSRGTSQPRNQPGFPALQASLPAELPGKPLFLGYAHYLEGKGQHVWNLFLNASGKKYMHRASLIAQLVKNPPAMQETPVQFQVREICWRRDRLPTSVATTPWIQGRSGSWIQWIQIFPVTQKVKNLLAIQETQIQSLSREDPLEKGMAIDSSILAWRIPWTEGPGGLQSVRSQRVEHD